MAVDGWFHLTGIKYKRTYSRKYRENFVAVELEFEGGGCNTVVYCPDNPQALGFWRRHMELVLGDSYNIYKWREDDLDHLQTLWDGWPVPKRVKLRTSKPSSKTGKVYLNIMDIDMEKKDD